MFDPLTSDNTSLAQYSSVQYSQGDEARPWIRHYEQGVPAHLALPDYPLPWLLDRTSERYPNQIAFSYYGLRLTYAQFLRDANRFAGALQRLGVKKGDRVAIVLPNLPQYPIAFYGAHQSALYRARNAVSTRRRRGARPDPA